MKIPWYQRASFWNMVVHADKTFKLVCHNSDDVEIITDSLVPSFFAIVHRKTKETIYVDFGVRPYWPEISCTGIDIWKNYRI